MSKREKIFVLSYVVLAFLLLIFIKNTLEDQSIQVLEAPKQKEAEEIKPAKVTLSISTCKGKRDYTERMTTQDSILTLLTKLRDEKKIYFELTEYTYGTEIEQVDKCDVKNGQWVVTRNKTEKLNDLDKYRVSDNDQYELYNSAKIF